MDPVDLVPLIEQLDDDIDDLEDAIAPLLQKNLSDIAGRLPLLDKAQLYVLATFAIESLLFSYLRLNEVDAKEHPVFRELVRVKQYFAKITEAETGASKRGSTLDKPAAGRFIKHALVLPLSFTVLCKRDVALIGDDKAGNEIYDRKRAQQQADEKARAHIRFEETSNKRKLEDTAISSTAANSQLIGATSSPMNLEGSSASISTQASPALDRPAEGSSVEHASNHDNGTMVPEQKSKKKRKKRPSKQERAEKLGVSKGEN